MYESGMNPMPWRWDKNRNCVQWKSKVEQYFTDRIKPDDRFSSSELAKVSVATGRVSMLYAIDFDAHAEENRAKIRECYEEFMSLPLVKRLVGGMKLYMETTPRGGFHVMFRYKTDEHIKKAVPARWSDKGTKIEVLADGNCVYTAPTTGYERLSIPTLDTLEFLDDDEFFGVLEPLGRFNEGTRVSTVHDRIVKEYKNDKEWGKDHPAYYYNRECKEEMVALLIKHGWTEVANASGKARHFVRPNKDAKDGISATLGHKDGLFYVFTDGDVKLTRGGYDYWKVYTMLEHNGVWRDSKEAMLDRWGLGVGVTTMKEKGMDTELEYKFVYRNTKGMLCHYQAMFTEYLTALGFRFYEDRYVRVEDNVVTEYKWSEIKGVVIEKYRGVNDYYEHISRNTVLFSTVSLASLPRLEGEFHRSGPHGVYLYFRNTVVKVTSDAITLMAYSELKGLVWRGWIIEREFDLDEDDQDGHFNMFIHILAGDDEEKVLQLKSIFGYLISGYNQLEINPIVLLYDMSDGGRIDGRTGKGLFAEGASQFMPMVDIPCGSMQADDQNLFSAVNEETRLIHLNDVNKDFNIKYLFGEITGGIHAKGKYKKPVVFSKMNSPKVIATANQRLQGSGGSYEDRVVSFEVDKYFSTSYRPKEEFGSSFYQGWSDSEWMKFYKTAIDCLHLYLTKGLIRGKQTDEVMVDEFFDPTVEAWFDGLDKHKFISNEELVEGCPRDGMTLSGVKRLVSMMARSRGMDYIKSCKYGSRRGSRLITPHDN